MSVIEQPRIEKWSGGTEVAIYPEGKPKTSFIGNHFLSWVAYLNQDESFKDVYSEHVSLTKGLLTKDIFDYLSKEELESIGVQLEGIALYRIEGQPKLYMAIDHCGNAIGHLACGFWSYKDGMGVKDIIKATNEIFATWPGKQIVHDAQKKGMVLPPPRGKGWEFPPNSRLVLFESFGDKGIVVPNYERLQVVDSWSEKYSGIAPTS